MGNLQVPVYGPDKILKFKVTTVRSKAISKSNYNVALAHRNTLTNVPIKYKPQPRGAVFTKPIKVSEKLS